MKGIVRIVDHALSRDTGYRWSKDDRDPVLDFVSRAITDSGMTLDQIAEAADDLVSVRTLARWQKGDTKRPMNIKVEAVLNALGFERRITAIRTRYKLKDLLH